MVLAHGLNDLGVRHVLGRGALGDDHGGVRRVGVMSASSERSAWSSVLISLRIRRNSDPSGSTAMRSSVQPGSQESMNSRDERAACLRTPRCTSVSLIVFSYSFAI